MIKYLPSLPMSRWCIHICLTSKSSLWVLIFCLQEINYLGSVMPQNLPCVIIQLSAVITWSNIVRYYINNYRNWGRISIRCWVHKNIPYLTLTGELWGVFCEYLWENWQHHNRTILYQFSARLCYLQYIGNGHIVLQYIYIYTYIRDIFWSLPYM